MDISDLRREYENKGLSLSDLHRDPIEQFRVWFEQARSAGQEEVNAMSLATASAEGLPSVRTVLLKAFSEKGFVFFTNYESVKAQQIKENPKVALLFPWLPLSRQVTVRGVAKKMSVGESLSYFVRRPVGSQLGAWVSAQSSVISSRALLEEKFAEVKRKFAQGKIPLPDFWGGYCVEPQAVEFWQGRANRLHDRFLYTDEVSEKERQWKVERLSP